MWVGVAFTLMSPANHTRRLTAIQGDDIREVQGRPPICRVQCPCIASRLPLAPFLVLSRLGHHRLSGRQSDHVGTSPTPTSPPRAGGRYFPSHTRRLWCGFPRGPCSKTRRGWDSWIHTWGSRRFCGGVWSALREASRWSCERQKKRKNNKTTSSHAPRKFRPAGYLGGGRGWDRAGFWGVAAPRRSSATGVCKIHGHRNPNNL